MMTRSMRASATKLSAAAEGCPVTTDDMPRNVSRAA